MNPDAAPDPSTLSSLLTDELNDYLNHQMGLHRLQDLLPPDVNLLEIRGPFLEFTQIPAPGNTLEDFATLLEGQDLELAPGLVEAVRSQVFKGKEARLYRHQERAIEAILRGKNVVLPHPTGSGKTEGFLVPILQRLLSEIADGQYGLGCLMIYPMKALENDQRDRIKKLLFELEKVYERKIPRIGVYDGDTPRKSDFDRYSGSGTWSVLQRYREECPRCGERNLSFSMGQDTHLLRCVEWDDRRGHSIGCGYPDDSPHGIDWLRTTREDMRGKHFPNLLITNPEALDFRLLTPEDTGVFKTKMKRVTVVVDEAHAYSAIGALGIQFLLARLEEKVREVNGDQEIEFQYVLSSATIYRPEQFSRELIPWVDFEVIPFEEDQSFPPVTEDSGLSVSGLSGAADPGSLEVFLGLLNLREEDRDLAELGMSREEVDGIVSAYVALGLAYLEEGKLLSSIPDLDEAQQLLQLDRKDEALTLAKDRLRKYLSSMKLMRDLYAHVSERSRSLEELVEWWKRTYEDEGTDAVASNILSVVRLGRSVGLWEERWHALVKAPVGIAGCSGEVFHPVFQSRDEPLPERCHQCDSKVYEIWTCNQCGKIYSRINRCRECGSGYSNATTCHDIGTESVLAPRSLLESGEEKLDPNDFLVPGARENCLDCHEKVVRPVRRRTDLLIEIAVSLLGWHILEEARRKFLLFKDGRAGAERIGREFNNLEIDLWADRLLFDTMTRDPRGDLHGCENYGDVQQKLLRRLYTPYNGLRRLLGPYEWDTLRKRITGAGFKALGRSASGASRLFVNGLMGYCLHDFEEEIQELGLETILPRLLDVIRLRGRYKRGITSKTLFKHVRGRPDHGEPSEEFSEWIEGLLGPENGKLNEALELLQAKGWIQIIHRKTGDFVAFRTEVQEEADPYESARDERKLTVPKTVWSCPRCGTVSWYRLSLCEKCGASLEEWSHEQLIKNHYFAEILAREPRPIVSAIHRAGLTGLERRDIEERFRRESGGFHFLSATPTLELGIDIGALNFALLAGVPPTRNSYIQRVGRAGRRREEGAICVTFTYPTPIDMYYFQNPERLVSMQKSRLPILPLSTENARPLLWPVVIDSLADNSPAGWREAVGKNSVKAFVESKSYNVENLREFLSKHWDKYSKDRLSRVLGRVTSRTVEFDAGASREMMDEMRAIVSSPGRFQEDIFRLASFKSHEMSVEELEREKLKSLTEMPRTEETRTTVSRLEKEYDGIREYKRRHMNSRGILLYLQGAGSLSSVRGIGGSINVYDFSGEGRLIDDRELFVSVWEMFPGAYFSRQGRIYRCEYVVYDPLDREEVWACPNSDVWLESKHARCPAHPDLDPVQMTLRVPVVAFATLAHQRDVETRGLSQKLIRSPENPRMVSTTTRGGLRVSFSDLTTVEVAGLCGEYDVYRSGYKGTRGPRKIQRCQNCKQFARQDCCEDHDPEDLVQGVHYVTRGVRIDLDIASADLRERFQGSRDAADEGELTQTFANALLNAATTTLDIEPTMLDATINPPKSLWVIEPAKGGTGLLGELLDPETQEALLDRIADLVSSTPSHSCARYCDQCLIVPRYSHSELDRLNRTLLEEILTAS